MGIISLAVLLVYYFIAKQHSYFLSNYVLVVFIILSLEFSRLLLYAVVDASAWPIPIRYLFPGMPLFSGLSILNLCVVINLLLKKLTKKYFSVAQPIG